MKYLKNREDENVSRSVNMIGYVRNISITEGYLGYSREGHACLMLPDGGKIDIETRNDYLIDKFYKIIKDTHTNNQDCLVGRYKIRITIEEAK